MGKKHGKQAAAKRGAKKREKELKRKARKAEARVARPAPVDDPLRLARRLVAGWRPATDGIEGLADALDVSWYTAALIAEDEREHHGRKDVNAAALPSTLHQETTEALVEALAARGIETDEAGFRERAAQYDGAAHLVDEAWLGERALPVHDRDLLRGAAVVLWSRWAADLVSNEELEELVGQASFDLDDPEAQPSLAAVAQVWERVRGVGGAERLRRANLENRYAYLVINAVHLAGTDDPERLQALRALLVEVTDSTDPGLDIGPDFLEALDDLDWRLGNPDEVLDRVLTEGRIHPDRVLDAAVMVLEHDATLAQLDRVMEALEPIRVDPLLGEHATQLHTAVLTARTAAGLVAQADAETPPAAAPPADASSDEPPG